MAEEWFKQGLLSLYHCHLGTILYTTLVGVDFSLNFLSLIFKGIRERNSIEHVMFYLNMLCSDRVKEDVSWITFLFL